MKFEITQTQINQILTLLNQCEVKGVAQMVVMLTSLTAIEEKHKKDAELEKKAE